MRANDFVSQLYAYVFTLKSFRNCKEHIGSLLSIKSSICILPTSINTEQIQDFVRPKTHFLDDRGVSLKRELGAQKPYRLQSFQMNSRENLRLLKSLLNLCSNFLLIEATCL